MNFSRSTTSSGFLTLVNIMSRGGTEDWQLLYDKAKGDPALRADLRAALPLVDPEVGEGRALWAYLLDRLDRVVSIDASEPVVSRAGSSVGSGVVGRRDERRATRR